MPRHVDQDVHAAFVEFRAGQDDKCMSVQCIYCQQVRAKNTTRQKQHLLQCAPYLRAHPEVALQASAASASAAAAAAATASATAATAVPAPTPSAHPAHAAGPGAPNATPIPPPAVHPVPSYGQDDVAGDHTTLSFMPNPRINGSPSQGRPSLGGDGTPAPKKQKTKATPGSNLPEIPLREVHAAFVEFRAKEDDKCMSVRCIYCNQVRAKNTSRQREHLMTCPGFQTVLKDKIPANNLRHQFDDEDVASSLALPTPSLDLDFRLSIRVKPKLNVGAGASGRQSWISCVGGQWAGRWGKGVVLQGGQDVQTSVKDTATRIDAQYLLQTSEEHPALFICKITGWLTGEREVMERLQDPVAADNVAANRYQLRATMQLETGDERYQDVNTGVWVCSGCRRGAEIVYDAYRIS
ncbi:uncharacterized protein THITE_2122361 [Thermothielavioides terrestris NRRL 8126]|uniref:Uncharacterized protein n=1 Tax=Thermothielavioides terrestris (strain ATCC 38088 / NRRL 8126) TaxID=578455 RepID=G2RCY9_THETT|nr:uncharacterized protein THITE_2122361 [Thermothielavioides terrestris NRRL 8126]AEO70682.1 hypothetical protein THITE_2122361 [Thermothielavioides terrestris NRRL 8126]